MVKRLWVFFSLCWALFVLYQATTRGWQFNGALFVEIFFPVIVGLFLRLAWMVAFLR